MERSRLRNEYIKDKTRAARIAYQKQRNVCLSILCQSKKCYCKNLNLGYRETFFLKQSKIKNAYITLKEGEKLIKHEYQIANIFNTFFLEIVPNLGTNVDER